MQTTLVSTNEVVKNIYARRAVRKYLDKPVDRNLIELIVDAGRMAPSAMNKQEWKFYVMTDKEQISLYAQEIRHSMLHILPKMGVKKIVKGALDGLKHLSFGIEFMKEEDPVFHRAPVVIFLAAPKEDEWSGLDLGMCAQNIMLTAKSFGLDTCPVGFGKFIMETPSYSKMNIPSNEEIVLSIIMGYGAEQPELHPRKKDNLKFLR